MFPIHCKLVAHATHTAVSTGKTDALAIQTQARNQVAHVCKNIIGRFLSSNQPTVEHLAKVLSYYNKQHWRSTHFLSGPMFHTSKHIPLLKRWDNENQQGKDLEDEAKEEISENWYCYQFPALDISRSLYPRPSQPYNSIPSSLFSSFSSWQLGTHHSWWPRNKAPSVCLCKNKKTNTFVTFLSYPKLLQFNRNCTAAYRCYVQSSEFRVQSPEPSVNQ